MGGRVSIRGRGRLPSPSYHPGVTNYSRSERIALADLLEELGPDAPTLCEGWTTADLAAHLVVRERRPDAGLGIVASPLARWTANVQASAKKRYGYQQLTQLVRQGPPLWSPLRPVDALANTVEYFVHHEDVRRATGLATARARPRTRGHADQAARVRQDAAAEGAGRGGAPAARRFRAGLHRRRAGGHDHRHRPRTAAVRVRQAVRRRRRLRRPRRRRRRLQGRQARDLAKLES
ncbi:MAG: TIGR03085 family metal-binding protein [Mycobacteriales bacterium]